MDTKKKIKLIGIVLTAIMLISIFAVLVPSGGAKLIPDSSTSKSESGLPEDLKAISKEAVPGQVIVGFHDSVSIKGDFVRQLVENNGGTIIEEDDVLNCILVEVSPEVTTGFTGAMDKERQVKYACPNYIVRIMYTPNDPLYPDQWGPQAIKADLAWDTEKGNKSVKIAIVDTGIDYTHEDLSGNYVSGGYDWVNNDNDPMDDQGHGTHCAGIATAVMDNEIGIAGIAQVEVMAEKVLDEEGSGSNWDVAEGIKHAANNGADVISLSLGGGFACPRLVEACEYAWDAGCIIVAASGNDNSDVIYPAAFDTVIAVGAIDNTSARAWFSNYGPELELMAPGVNIISTVPDFLNETSMSTIPELPAGYDSWSGTSMATPHVAGAAALVWSNCPELTNQEVRDLLDYTADDLGDPGWDEYYGCGRVDAEEAIICDATCDIWIAPESFELEILENGVRDYTLTIGNSGDLMCLFDKYEMVEEIWSDDMETCPGGWSHGGDGDEWECGAPDHTNYTDGPESAYSGDNCWGTDLDDTYGTNADEWLMSPVIDLSGVSSAAISFYQWHALEVYYSTPKDFGYVEISTNNGTSWTTIETYTGYEEEWTKETIDISAYTGSNETRIRFRLDSDYVTNKAGLYIDDVLIYEPCDWLSEDISEGAVYSGSSVDVTLTCDTAGLSPGTYTATIVLESTDPDEDRIDIQVNLTVLVGGDPDIWVDPAAFALTLSQGTKTEETLEIGNDGAGVLSFDITDTAGTVVFDDDMESCPGGWTHSGDQDEWECGTPTYEDGPSEAHSGDNCWGTDLDDKYENNANASLVSPAIDLSYALNIASLKFYRWYALEEGYDDAYVEISPDNGATWNMLIEYTGYEEEWVEEVIDISDYAGSSEVRIRFRLDSDFSVGKAGLYIDDVEVMPGNWLCLDPTEGSVYVAESENVTVTFDVTHLGAGDYDATIVIANNDPDEDPVNVPVTLTVTAPDIWVDPTGFDVTLSPGSEWNGTLEVGNDGTETLVYEISDEETATKVMLTQGFEEGIMPPTGWTNTSSSNKTWDISTTAHSGSYGAICWYGYEGNPQDEWLISEPIDLSARKNIQLSFWWKSSYYWMVTEDNFDVFVKVSTDGGTSWDTVWVSGDIGEFETWEWYDTTFGEPIDLSAYAGNSSVLIAWDFVGEDTAAFYLDDIVLTGDCPWLDESAKAGTIGTGGSDVIAVSIDTTGLGSGDYHADIVIGNNDPDEDPAIVPVNLAVSGGPTPPPTPTPTPTPTPADYTMKIDDYDIYLGGEGEVVVPVEVLNATDIAGGSARILFDASVVNVREVTPGQFGDTAALINNTAGFVNVASAGTFAIGEPEAVLANIVFEGMSEGYTELNIENAILNTETSTIIPATIDGSITVEVGIQGDVNHNGFLDTGDATLVLRMVVGLIPPDVWGDMNGNGFIDTGDATLILRKIVGLD